MWSKGGETTPLLSASMRLDEDRFYMGMDKHTLLNTPESGLSTVEAARRLKQFGPNEFEAQDAASWRRLASHFIGPMPLLLWLVMALELVTKDIPDLAVLLFLQVLNGVVGWIDDAKTAHALFALKAALKPEAQVIRDGVHQTINASLLVPGDRLTLTVGCAVPADCDLCDGSPIQVDQSALTGESFPVTLHAGDNVKMGSLVVHGDVEAIVSATGVQTFLGQHPPSAEWPAKNTLYMHFTHITMALLLLTLLCVSVLLGCLLYNGVPLLSALSVGLVVVVAAVPLTLRSVCTSILALGSRQLAAEKVLVTHLPAIETMSRLNIVCADKTGTLTRNKMELQDDVPLFAPHASREDILVMAALAAKWREPPRDAIDTLVLNAIDLRPLDAYTLLAHTPFEPTAKRTESTIKTSSGKVFKVTKGAPHMVLSLAHNVDDIADAVTSRVLDLAKRGVRCLAVARTEDAIGWVLMGLLTFVDPPRHDTKRSIELLQWHGINLKMLTGDNAAVAIETAHLLQVGSTILGSDAPLTSAMVENADGFANVFPAHKVRLLTLLSTDATNVVGVTGNDVQDAPALRLAHLGIAVDGASDAARAAADVVLTKPGLAVLLHGVLLARHVCQRVTHYVIYRVATGLHLLAFLVVATVCFSPSGGHFAQFSGSGGNATAWTIAREDAPASFQLPLIAIALLLLLNDGAIGSTMAQDVVGSRSTPQGWSGPRTALIAGTLGAVSALGSLLSLYWSLDSWNSGGVWQQLGLHALSYRQVLMVAYLQLSLSGGFLVFSARTDAVCCLQAPSKLLVVATGLSSVAATTLSLFWPFADMQAIPAPTAAAVWVYTLLWLFVQESAKLLALTLYEHATRNRKPARMEWQRVNRMQLGNLRAVATATPLSASSSSSRMLRDSFVAGRAVTSSVSTTMNLDQAIDRLGRLEAEMKAVRHVIQAASASTN
ncbi:plasma-membrane proton-efflux P-type ATPase [Saprolegnia parasitica CBS 223.65]|uniref:Plasma membrane ATPase n=1 Tax=Saprolegnia parasitica (strain CBS 223.65) TaxID=695850 RepID=A0A067CYH7_SAPPC|nr:plasma-membrane proton-efflux P-type ATPase [Saprolegnia parasitica CBS 223.65]KDO31857.1 plasma-membrane proton-efflux P-type ATPase [Saprolegnia parasitica CBS 223.65]|eukprot:XP_012197735.1 plasma-membrane proton-efflux P-type ATPase [Saprolegnia parasitica CBS 223.65]